MIHLKHLMYHIKTKKLPKILPSLLGYALVLTELGSSRPRLDYNAVQGYAYVLLIDFMN